MIRSKVRSMKREGLLVVQNHTMVWYIVRRRGPRNLHNDYRILMWGCLSRDVQQLGLMTSELVNIQVDREQPSVLSLFYLQKCLVIAS